MRPSGVLALAVVLVLAGCSGPLGATDRSGANATQTTAATETTDSNPPRTSEGTAASTTNPAGSGSTTSGATASEPSTAATGPGQAGAPPDPPADRLGWENGIWYNQSLPVDAANGLNATERGAVVNRTMARIEVVRRLEYTQPVPVDLVSREQFQGGSANSGVSPAFRTFDNAKFEAMFLVGEDENSLAAQSSNTGSSVLGYYSPGNDSIVVVSDSSTPQLRPGTLSHELTHALQDQQFDLTDDRAPTRDAYNARNGLVEGGANYVQGLYGQRFEDSWAANATQESGSSGSNQEFNYGIYFLEYFPYADGPGFVSSLRERGGWQAVNDAYGDLPTSSEQVIYPRRYEEDRPRNVTLADRSSSEWERVGPGEDRAGNRPSYATLGQSALSAMFAYTITTDRGGEQPVISPRAFLNTRPNGSMNRSDPYNYDLPATNGWDGDRLYAYRNDAGESGYVWKLVWDSPRDAREFANEYESLLRYWGGQQVGSQGTTTTWRIADGPFADSFRVQANGENVTITNAPTTEGLDGVRGS